MRVLLITPLAFSMVLSVAFGGTYLLAAGYRPVETPTVEVDLQTVEAVVRRPASSGPGGAPSRGAGHVILGALLLLAAAVQFGGGGLLIADRWSAGQLVASALALLVWLAVFARDGWTLAAIGAVATLPTLVVSGLRTRGRGQPRSKGRPT